VYVQDIPAVLGLSKLITFPVIMTQAHYSGVWAGKSLNKLSLSELGDVGEVLFNPNPVLVLTPESMVAPELASNKGAGWPCLELALFAGIWKFNPLVVILLCSFSSVL
jgi:hypothetical protein